MAERPLDRLMPQALALIFGMAALAAGLAGIAADSFIGRPSSTSGVGIVLILPLALFAAVVGFAAGHGVGALLRRNGMTPSVPIAPYRIVMAFVLGVTTVIAATFGARPVIKHERLHEPRVITGGADVDREDGAPEGCAEPVPAVLACDVSTGISATAIVWNGREVTVGCTREGRITVSDADAGVVASADLSAFEYMRGLRAAVVRQEEGREALALLAGLRATGRRHMFLIFDADGRAIYQELLQGRAGEHAAPLAVCANDDAAALVVDVGSPVTYRTK